MDPDPDPTPNPTPFFRDVKNAKKQCCGSGSGAFLTPGSGMGRKSAASGSGIRDEQPGSYFLELRNHFLG